MHILVSKWHPTIFRTGVGDTKSLRYQQAAKRFGICLRHSDGINNGRFVWGPNRWGNQRPGHWTPLDSAVL